MRRIALLGSTGSIGESTLAVLRRHPDRFKLVAVTAHANGDKLQAQVAQWRPEFAGLSSPMVDGWNLPTGPDVLVTASGGPFRCWDAADVAGATVAQALKHPTWSMGSKITVDSATLANKALELIEAHFLFGLPYDALEAVVHPQSIVHAFAEFTDGSVLAQLGFPSMELPILYALTHPDRIADDGVRRFDPVAIGQMTFEPVRADVFRAFALGVASGRAGGTAPATFNAANEEAVAGFLSGRIPFGRIAETIDAVLQRHDVRTLADVATVRDADATARAMARRAMES